MTSKEKLEHYRMLWEDAKAKRQDVDSRIERRKKLYKGTDEVRDKVKGGISSRKATCYKNMCFELVETQINNAIPSPKVTPRDSEDNDLALEIEGYLKAEMDRIQFERINDKAERETYIQGTVFFLVGWDSLENTPKTQGELTVKMYPLEQVYPQPGITELEDAEYIFVKELVSIKRLKKLYGVDVMESGRYKGKAELITCYYYSDEGYISRIAWVEDKLVYDQEDYELRKFRQCAECGEYNSQDEICPVCGSKKFKWVSEKEETLTDDIVKVVINPDGSTNKDVLAKKGDSIPYYKIRKLPFVIRTNVSQSDSLYGISDIDVLENEQESSNKLLSKMEENVLKGGSIITVPDKKALDLGDSTLKVVPIKDPKLAQYFSVQSVQASIQQEDILQQRMYDNGRTALGITDSYQGKRDPTAESGKAKEVAAAQSAGRLESKKRMKDAAYGNLYEMMFKFLLAYCDERRSYAKLTAEGEYVPGKFFRYNYLKGTNGDIYYNDRFLFSVDSASTLSSDRASMWKEATNNFQAGTFGNPADPASLLLYWNVMKGLGYPLAKTALANMQQRTKQLPFEIQQAMLQNPSMMETVEAMMSGQAEVVPKQIGDNKDIKE